MTDLIDPATEIAELLRYFANQNASDQPTWSIIQNATATNGAELWDMVAVLTKRLSTIRHFVLSLQDEDLDKAKRNRAIGAIDRFAATFNGENLNTAWKNVRQIHVIEDDALQLSWFAPIARKYRPLKKLNHAEREQLAKNLRELLEKLPASSDIPEWAKEPLLDGLQRLHLLITKVEFFGYDTAIDGLLTVYWRVSQVENRLNDEERDKPVARPSILQILNVVALAVNLFSAPDMVSTALRNYRGWELFEMKSSPLLARCETLLLTGPTNHRKERDERPADAIIESQPPRPDDVQ